MREYDFKVGQKVVCIDTRGNNKLVLNGVYVISKMGEWAHFGKYVIYVQGIYGANYAYRFKQADDLRPRLAHWLRYAQEYVRSQTQDNEIKELLTRLESGDSI